MSRGTSRFEVTMIIEHANLELAKAQMDNLTRNADIRLESIDVKKIEASTGPA